MTVWNCTCAAVNEWMVTSTFRSAMHHVNYTVNHPTPNHTNTTISGNSRQCISTTMAGTACRGFAVKLQCTTRTCYHAFNNGTLAVTPNVTHFKLWLLSLSHDVLGWLWHFNNGTVFQLFIICIASLKIAKWVAETCRWLLYIQIFHYWVLCWYLLLYYRNIYIYIFN